jgi:phosphatidylglycerophosphate synthase
MFEAFRTFVRADAVSAAFMLIYAGVLAGLLALSYVYGRVVPKRERKAAPAAGLSPMQRRARSAAYGFAHFIASLNITPNQITVIGLLLVALNCGLYLCYRDPFMFGTGLIAAYLFDTLDGVVARAQGTSSKFGGYLDAVIDRYQEVITYLTVGWVTQLWLPVFLLTTGSMLTSYNKARTAIETPIDNKGWPDLLAKPTRTFFLATALIGGNSVPWFLPGGLWVLAAMTHLTALHRFGRAYLMLRPLDRQQDTGG